MKDTDFASALWRKSSHSGGQTGECVEVAAAHGMIALRDSKNPGGPKLAIHPAGFRRLVRQIKNDELGGN